MKKVHKHIGSVLTKLLLAVNILVIVMLLLSAFGGYINPHSFGWEVSLGLLFPFLAVATFAFMIAWLIAGSKKWLWSFGAFLLCVGKLHTYCPVSPQSEERLQIVK